jgi:DNA-binding protein HU-beta
LFDHSSDAILGGEQEVADGKRLSLPGLGTFKLNYRAARKGRNPASGEEIDIRALYVPSFSASKTFKDMCNPDR